MAALGRFSQFIASFERGVRLYVGDVLVRLRRLTARIYRAVLRSVRRAEDFIVEAVIELLRIAWDLTRVLIFYVIGAAPFLGLAAYTKDLYWLLGALLWFIALTIKGFSYLRNDRHQGAEEAAASSSGGYDDRGPLRVVLRLTLRLAAVAGVAASSLLLFRLYEPTWAPPLPISEWVEYWDTGDKEEDKDLIAQRSTVKDIRNVGTALASWAADRHLDRGVPRFNGFDALQRRSYYEILKTLRPSESYFYMTQVPEHDGWGFPLEFRVSDSDDAGPYIAIRSPGRDGNFAKPGPPPGPFDAQLSDEDIVWIDGCFVRWPAGAVVRNSHYRACEVILEHFEQWRLRQLAD